MYHESYDEGTADCIIGVTSDAKYGGTISMEEENFVVFFTLTAAICHSSLAQSQVLSVPRILAMRVTSAYKTVATSPVLVLAGTPPSDLLVLESREI